MIDDENKSYPIPEKFRASIDLTDEAAFALLQKNDAEQKVLSERVNSPFTKTSPLGVQRQKAAITIKNLLQVQQFQPLVDAQIEQLAEAYAFTGRYDLAAETSKVNSAHYEAIWEAVFKDDGDWCSHGSRHQYVSDHVYSIRDQKEHVLLKCNMCRHLNVMAKPDHLVQKSQGRAVHNGKTGKMNIQQALTYHQNNVRKS